MKRKILFLLVFLIVPVLAFALMVLRLNLEQLTALSDQVFRGRCVSVLSKNDEAGRPIQEVTYDVDEMLKGAPSKKVTFRQIGLASDITEGDMPQYEVGEESILFLSAPGKLGLTAPVALKQGKFSVQTSFTGQKIVKNGVGNRGLFVGMKKSSQFKSFQRGQELSYTQFISLVKKLSSN